MNKFTFGKEIVINCFDTEEEKVLRFAIVPFEEIVYEMQNLCEYDKINFVFLTEEHKKDFLENDVVPLLQECHLQKRAIRKILLKADCRLSFSDYYELICNENSFISEYGGKLVGIEKFEKELLFFLSNWI